MITRLNVDVIQTTIFFHYLNGLALPCSNFVKIKIFQLACPFNWGIKKTLFILYKVQKPLTIKLLIEVTMTKMYISTTGGKFYLDCKKKILTKRGNVQSTLKKITVA